LLFSYVDIFGYTVPHWQDYIPNLEDVEFEILSFATFEHICSLFFAFFAFSQSHNYVIQPQDCHYVNEESDHTFRSADSLWSLIVGCEVYNLGTGKGTSVLEMVAAFEKASEKVLAVLESHTLLFYN